MSADVAKAKAQVEYDKWHVRQLDQPNSVERHFIDATQNAKRIAVSRPKPKGKPEKT